MILAQVDHDSEGRKIAWVSAGQVTVTVYESLSRPGGITVDVTTQNDHGPEILISVNDDDLFLGVPGQGQ